MAEPRRLVARARRVYWKRLRGHRYEICGSVNPASPAYATIRRYGCGRPIGPIWRASSGIWNFVVTGQPQTVYTVREGAAGGPITERAEGEGGILCLRCFDRAARARGLNVMWESGPL